MHKLYERKTMGNDKTTVKTKGVKEHRKEERTN